MGKKGGNNKKRVVVVSQGEDSKQNSTAQAIKQQQEQEFHNKHDLQGPKKVQAKPVAFDPHANQKVEDSPSKEVEQAN